MADENKVVQDDPKANVGGEVQAPAQPAAPTNDSLNEKQEVRMIEYIVVKGPVAKVHRTSEDADPVTEVYQTGNVITFAEGDPLAASFISEGMIHLKVDAPKENTTAPAMPTEEEPRKRYRGKLVLTDGFRMVGVQQFRHLRLEDGTTLDLTEDEYQGEVKLSFPPLKK